MSALGVKQTYPEFRLKSEFDPRRKSEIHCWWKLPNVATRAPCPCTSACRPRRRTYPISLARPDPPSTAIRDLSDIQSTLPRLLRSNDALWEPRSGMLRTGSGASACPSMRRLCRKWDRCFGTTASNRSGFARRRRPAWPPAQNACGDSRIESRIRFRCCLSSHRGGTQAAARAPNAEPRYLTVMFCDSGRRTSG